LIGKDTKELIEGLWVAYERGLAHLKGLDEPVETYSLLRSG